MSKNYLEKITEHNPIVIVGKEVKDLIKQRSENKEKSKENAEKAHGEFVETCSKAKAKKASKSTDRGWSIEITVNPKEKTISGKIESKDKDTTYYEGY